MTAGDWSSGSQYHVKSVDPCPEGVKRMSEVEVVKKGNQQSKIQQEVCIIVGIISKFRIYILFIPFVN